MINLLQLSKILLIAFFFTLISFNLAISEEADEAVVEESVVSDDAPVDVVEDEALEPAAEAAEVESDN